MKYALWLKQSGEGCDYTIGCGERIYPLEATTLEEAKEEIAEGVAEGDIRSGDDIEEAVIYSFEDDVLDIFESHAQEMEDARLEEEKDKKRAQLARLKQELGEE